MHGQENIIYIHMYILHIYYGLLKCIYRVYKYCMYTYMQDNWLTFVGYFLSQQGNNRTSEIANFSVSVCVPYPTSRHFKEFQCNN